MNEFGELWWYYIGFGVFVVDSGDFLDNLGRPLSTCGLIMVLSGQLGWVCHEFRVEGEFSIFLIVGDSWQVHGLCAEFRTFFEWSLIFCCEYVIISKWGWGCWSEFVVTSGRAHELLWASNCPECGIINYETTMSLEIIPDTTATLPCYHHNVPLIWIFVAKFFDGQNDLATFSQSPWIFKNHLDVI